MLSKIVFKKKKQKAYLKGKDKNDFKNGYIIGSINFQLPTIP
jgi:hypothetical protein